MDISTSLMLGWGLLSYVIVISYLVDDYKTSKLNIHGLYRRVSGFTKVVFFVALALFIVLSPFTALYVIYEKVRS